MEISDENYLLQAKYDLTAWFYDILDYPWERIYKRWRPKLLSDVRGRVLEAGVGTGRNLEYYHSEVELTGIDLSKAMLKRASKRKRKATCRVELIQQDATNMNRVASGYYDWLFSTFLCCVMLQELQPQALAEFQRILKPGGRFRILEIVYSSDPKIRKRQELFAPFVERVYGARFDRRTLYYLEQATCLKITHTKFLKDDTYLLIEGTKLI